MPTNNTIGLAGRFCNHVIRNLYLSFLAQKSNLAVKYSYENEIKRLGIPLFTEGTETYEKTLVIRDEDFLSYMDSNLPHNLFVDFLSAQHPEFALRVYNFFRESKGAIQAANVFKDRYNSNKDVFVHVRLDDAASWNPGYAYYETALKKTGASSGFISSDSPDHPFVTGLAAKYGLSIVKKDEVETIMLASTCAHVILSHGTFSWVMGALAFYGTVSVPPPKYNVWCGHIFSMPGWEIIDLLE